MTTQRKIVWTLGNVFILAGMFLLLFVGGLFADEQYNVYAASGDNDVVAPVVVRAAPAPVVASNDSVAGEAGDASTEADDSEAPAAQTRPSPRFDIPVLNNSSADALTNAVPSSTSNSGPSTVTRIVAPTIGLDKKVVEVGWTVQQIEGQEIAVWDVDQYRVGHNKGSSNPGGGDNIVLAGHSGGRAYPFNDIFYLKPGDPIELTSNGTVFAYSVSDHILVDEVGQPLEKRLENARYIEPTGEEVITMVACWPLTGPDKFNQRIIIRAKPVGGAVAADDMVQQYSGWTPR